MGSLVLGAVWEIVGLPRVRSFVWLFGCRCCICRVWLVASGCLVCLTLWLRFGCSCCVLDWLYGYVLFVFL